MTINCLQLESSFQFSWVVKLTDVNIRHEGWSGSWLVSIGW